MWLLGQETRDLCHRQQERKQGEGVGGCGEVRMGGGLCLDWSGGGENGPGMS